MRMGFVNMRLAIACLWMFGVAAVRGEDLTTLTGLTFSNIEVREVKWDSLLIKHDTGISKVFLAEIPADLRAHYKQMAPPPEPRAAPAAPATQEPVGSNDLATLSGMQYRNVAVRRVEKDAVLISHDGGLAKIYFSELSEEQREHYRVVPRATPETPPGTNDLVAADGRIYRNVRVRRIEPDALTFHHDEGVTKVAFELLSEDVQKKYEYNSKAAAAYRRDMAAAQEQAERDRQANRAQNDAARRKQIQAEPIRVFGVLADEPKERQYRIRFSVRNNDVKPANVRASINSCLPVTKTFTIPAESTIDRLEISTSCGKPTWLEVHCGVYSTKQPLDW